MMCDCSVCVCVCVCVYLCLCVRDAHPLGRVGVAVMRLTGHRAEHISV